jgi:lipopolysaccharide biosynthesis glycosyltransferase
MEVLCACDKRYLPHAATMLCSLLEHNTVSRIHLFYSAISSYELTRLKRFFASYRSEIALYEIVPSDLQNFRVDKWLSIATYYRLLAPRLLPADLSKVLYLDSDIIVRGSLTELWNTDLTGCALAAVSNYWEEDREGLGMPAEAKYFNAGVLLINLQFWRLNNVAERALSFVKNNPERLQYWDQDALNATLVHQWIEVPSCWNCQYISNSETEPEPAVVHFLTRDKPWQWSNTHIFKHEYRRYRLKTPWRRYKLEGQPPSRLGSSLRRVARVVLPRRVVRWLRSSA